MSLLQKLEVHEDEDQGFKCQQIIEMLVSAGYYRARINALENFDKIIGGITWCIESCYWDIDIDLLFHENLTIGQKISLTEKIVRMLPKMNCPCSIEPHQIQGLDCIHIFPVIQWLIKESMKVREEMAENLHLFAITQLNDNRICLEPQYVNSERHNLLIHMRTIKTTYKSYHRIYQQKNNVKEDEMIIVSKTLLEYGDNFHISQSVINELQKIQSTDITEDMDVTIELFSRKPHIDELTINLYKVIENKDYYNCKGIFKIINVQTGEVSKEASAHIMLSNFEYQYRKPFPILYTTITLEKQKLSFITIYKKLALEKEIFIDKFTESMEFLKKIRERRLWAKTLHAYVEDIKILGTLSTIKKLLFTYEDLKNQENLFRDYCLVNLNSLKNMVDHLKIDTPQESLENLCKLKNKMEIVAQLRLQLGKKIRIIATLTRQLDDTPERSELTQYQRRFMELYSQVSAKHRETKQYYTLYNTLDDTKLYLSKELSLLNSIQENYNIAMSSNDGRGQFLRQFENILIGVQRNKTNLNYRCMEEKNKRDVLSIQLITLMEHQRKYIIAVGQLTNGCRRNEMLLSRLRDSKS